MLPYGKVVGGRRVGAGTPVRLRQSSGGHQPPLSKRSAPAGFFIFSNLGPRPGKDSSRDRDRAKRRSVRGCCLRVRPLDQPDLGGAGRPAPRTHKNKPELSTSAIPARQHGAAFRSVALSRSPLTKQCGTHSMLSRSLVHSGRSLLYDLSAHPPAYLSGFVIRSIARWVSMSRSRCSSARNSA